MADITEQIDENLIQAKIVALKKLPNLKTKSDEYLRNKAIEIIKRNTVDIDIAVLFQNKDEAKKAKELLTKYLSDYSIETIAEKNTLRELIYLEIVQSRLQEKLNEYYEKDSKAVPIQLIEVIHKNSDAILKLKDSLGLGKDKNKRSAYDALQHLLRRAKKWREENQASRTLSCPHCGKMILLKIRTEMWEAQKHPFFKDKVLYNEHLFKMLNEQKVSKEDVAKVLECSPDYISWVIEKIQGKNEEQQRSK